jgi:hypothetical protein
MDRDDYVRSLSQADLRVYCAAVFAWKHREERCPNRIKDKDGVPRLVTWERWFEISFGRSLLSYTADVNDQRERAGHARRDTHGK